MRCKSCGSENLTDYTAEIAIHLQRIKNVFRPHVFVFPAVIVCLGCGRAEFVVREEELRQLKERRAAGA